MKTKEEIIEELAEIEHEQWMEWSKHIANEEDISDERYNRWETKLWKPYKMLSEENKEQDRKWARKVLEKVELALEKIK